MFSNSNKNHNPTIKHLVLSGGGITGFSTYGVLRESNKAGFWHIDNIQTIYCTSVGSIFAMFMILLKSFDWDTYDDFMIKRPWHHVFNFNLQSIIQSYETKGIFSNKIIEDTIRPVLSAIDLSIDITLKQLYEYTNIDAHFITSELHSFQMVDLSHTTHPDWRLVDAVYCSCCLPVLFSPFSKDTELYMDGALFQHFPVNACIKNGAEIHEIFGINKIFNETVLQPQIDTLLDYVLFLVQKVLDNVAIKEQHIPYQVNIVSTPITLYDIYKGTSDIENRKQLIQDGVDAWNQFYESFLQGTNSNTNNQLEDEDEEVVVDTEDETNIVTRTLHKSDSIEHIVSVCDNTHLPRVSSVESLCDYPLGY
jgi:predicted acylesterase/phospholipase RssA